MDVQRLPTNPDALKAFASSLVGQLHERDRMIAWLSVGHRTLPSDPVQAVSFDFAMSRSQAHPNRMLARFEGTLQVDGYAGYNETLRRAKVIEAGCLAHARRKFVEVFDSTKSPVAQQAIARIAALYKVEHEIDASAEDVSILDRQRLRQARAGPLLKNFHEWLLASYGKTPPRSALAKAMQYTLNRWVALTRYVEDGRLPLDTNAVENCIRPVATTRSLCTSFISACKHWDLV